MKSAQCVGGKCLCNACSKKGGSVWVGVGALVRARACVMCVENVAVYVHSV